LTKQCFIHVFISVLFQFYFNCAGKGTTSSHGGVWSYIRRCVIAHPGAFYASVTVHISFLR